MIQLKPEDFKAVECVPVPEIVVKMAALALSRGEDGMDEFLQLPKVEDVPRPGAVRGWEIDDWRNFAIKSGWKEVEQTKHQFLFEHRVWTDGIRFGIAKTPGDWRSGMNSCSDLRKRFLSWRMMLYTALKALAEGGLIPKPVAKIWGDPSSL